MTPAQLRLRLCVASVLVFGGLWLHERVQTLVVPVLTVDSALEQAIPFLPWAIWIYLSFFLVIGWAVLRVDEARFWRLVSATVIAALLAWSIVLVLPISFHRPDPASIGGEWHRRIYAFVHAADPAHITFPSLHVAVTWICILLLWPRPGRGWRLILGVAISLSTLFTKQHLVLDVLGGLALAWLCVWLTGMYYPPEPGIERISCGVMRRR